MSGKSRRVTITGVGSCIPERVLTNHDLERMVDTSDEWIQTRTGIRERRVVDADTAASDLGLVAARRALEEAGVEPSEVDLIIVATITPDMNFPATACLIQDRLGATRAAAFDIEAACSGFIYALVTGAQFIENGLYRNVLVVGTETLSKITDWKDRRTCVLFGDGAGAVLLQPAARDDEGLLGFDLGSDGSGSDFLKLPGGGSRMPASEETVRKGLHFVAMNGREVFKFAVRAMGESGKRALERCGLTFDELDFYVPHQANLRIITASARRFGLPMERVYVNIDRYGNTSSASIPVALDEALDEGRLRPGDRVLLVAFGGGLTWGAAVMRWTLERSVPRAHTKREG